MVMMEVFTEPPSSKCVLLIQGFVPALEFHGSRHNGCRWCSATLLCPAKWAIAKMQQPNKCYNQHNNRATLIAAWTMFCMDGIHFVFLKTKLQVRYHFNIG